MAWAYSTTRGLKTVATANYDSAVASNAAAKGSPPYRYWDDESCSQWCTCRAYRRKMTETNRLFRQADMPERYKWKFIDDFHIVAPDGTPVQLADTAHRYMERLISAPEEPRRGCLLHGWHRQDLTRLHRDQRADAAVGQARPLPEPLAEVLPEVA